MSAALTYNHTFDLYGTVSMPNKGDIKSTENIEESYFKNVQYFLSEKNKPFLNFDSELLTLSTSDSKVLGFNPKGNAYRMTDSSPIFFQGKNARVYYAKKEINLENQVNVVVDNTNLDADRVKILLGDNLLIADGNVKTLTSNDSNNEQILVNSDELEYRPKVKYFEFRKNVDGTLKRKKVYEESLKFKTDALNFNGLNNLAELKGNIHLMRENYDIFATNGNIYLENYNKKLKYYVLSDDVRLEEKVEAEGRKFSRKAFSEKLEGVMSEKKIVLTGFPKVFQDKDVIKGNMIVIRENVETVEVDDANTNITLKNEEKKRE